MNFFLFGTALGGFLNRMFYFFNIESLFFGSPCDGAVGSADWGSDFLRYGVFFYAVTLIRTVSYIFLSVRSAGGTFVDWNKSTQKFAFSYAAFVTEIGFAGENPIIVHDAAKVRQFFAHV